MGREDGDGRTGLSPARSAPHVATAVLLLALALAVVTDAEWWPVSSMRLFSSVRGPSATSWRVTLLAGGTEQALQFGRLDRGFHGAHQLIPRMVSMDPGDRDAICSQWATAAARRGYLPADSIRVDRVIETLSRRTGDPVGVAVHPAFECRVDP